jgi:3-oxoacyl-[acyl-carrier protein] reductase
MSKATNGPHHDPLPAGGGRKPSESEAGEGRHDGSGELAGQIALVTGATRGIGRAIADALARAGARVIGTATTDEGAAAIGAHLRERGGEGMRLDVRDAASIDALLKDIDARHGAIGILVNNAGITRDNLLVRMKDDEWDAIMATNLRPAFHLAKAVLRGMMKARRGRIIQIGSVVGSTGNAGQANYAAAKAALVAFTKSLAQEVASRGITVNCVAPGFIDTDMTQALAAQQREALLARIPLGRLGTPEDVADAVAFLAGPRAGYITGTTLHVNGGMFMP